MIAALESAYAPLSNVAVVQDTGKLGLRKNLLRAKPDRTRLFNPPLRRSSSGSRSTSAGPLRADLGTFEKRDWATQAVNHHAN